MRRNTALLLTIGLLGACIGAAITHNGGSAAAHRAAPRETQDPIRLDYQPAVDKRKVQQLTPIHAPSAVGPRALAYAERIVAMGPRYPGRPGWSEQLDLIERELRLHGLEPKRDTWTDRRERITFTNLSATIPGKRPERIVLACHHDTKCTVGLPKKEHNFHFVGANDGASGVALLLALVPELQRAAYDATLELVFFDGEESLDWNWNDATRALFGSRRFVKRHREALLLGEEPRIEAMILLDMVGRTDLHIQDETYSTLDLRQIAWSAVVATGHQESFYRRSQAASDDHAPFLKAGIPSVDLIDLDQNPYWHTPMDTLEHLSADSLQKVADVVLTMLPAVEQRYVKSPK